MFYSLLHLVAFRWEAHGKSLATFLSGTKKMPESLALSKFLYLSHTLHTPVSPSRERARVRVNCNIKTMPPSAKSPIGVSWLYHFCRRRIFARSHSL